MSWVFLTDREVWELKRPVDYSGSGKSTLAIRARSRGPRRRVSGTSISTAGEFPLERVRAEFEPVTELAREHARIDTTEDAGGERCKLPHLTTVR